MPNPLPIIAHYKDRMWLIDGGDGKFYLWQDLADYVGELYERNLAIILSAMVRDPEFEGFQWRKIGDLGCGPADFDVPWSVDGARLPKHGLGSISKYEPTDSLYIKLEEFVIPPGWSNDPLDLHLAYCFDGKVVEENLTKELKTDFNLPNPLPIIVHKQHGLWLIDGGNEKFYAWQNVEGYLGEFYERDLAMLLFAVGKDPHYKECSGGKSDKYVVDLQILIPPWRLNGKVLPKHAA